MPSTEQNAEKCRFCEVTGHRIHVGLVGGRSVAVGDQLFQLQESWTCRRSPSELLPYEPSSQHIHARNTKARRGVREGRGRVTAKHPHANTAPVFLECRRFQSSDADCRTKAVGDSSNMQSLGRILCGASRQGIVVRTVSTVLQTLPPSRRPEPFESKTRLDDNLRPLYLDTQATTPLDPRVLDEMLPYQVGSYGNPHSRSHQYGWESEAAVERARERVARLVNADAKEIVFTSGATESNNIAIKGVARFYGEKKRHVITTQTEHKCVLDSCRALEAEGFRVTYLPVDKNGLISLATLEAALTPDTAVVSIMTVNNEIGVRQPVEEIGKICRSKKVFFHTDAAQAIGKIPVDVNSMNIDLMSISGHKIYGPKGVGALYVRRRPRVRVEPLQSGGGQERGLRSGTVPAPLVVGLGAACHLAQREMAYDHKHISRLSELLIRLIMSELTHVVRNGDSEKTYPGCVNLSFSCVEGESLLMAMKDVALSSGSACTSASLEPSYVLRAIGSDEDLAHSSIRFGIGRFTTEDEVRYTARKIIEVVKRLREMSPLWDMVQEGIDLKTIQWSQH
ncbi:cysteine desulfurase [Tropilaelaps mercedesae]|uniref:cysteine desulfurase n=1 Tax=Tropilaelaps mercedesae TaxID=418985 RepID=A0A1V9XC13_9ACAR|nr:cysteine desulfurase [Tropilaelaps mercedesae]